jgi:hypothetical protein
MIAIAVLWSFIASLAPAALQGPAQAPSAIPAGTARITGKVTRLDNDRPVAGASLQLQYVSAAVQGPGSAMTVRTDAQGVYAFERLGEGAYTVVATAEHFFPPDAVTNRPSGFGKRLDLVNGQQLDRVDFVLVPAAGIEGRTLDEFGDPAPGVTMMVTQLMQAVGRSRLMPLGRATSVTDDRGAFRVSGLAPGDYYLIALSGPFGTQGAAALSMPSDTRAGFAPTYFPGTATAADARPVHIDVGHDTTGVTFTLVPSKLFTVAGRVTDPSGASPAGGLQLLQTQGGDVRAIVPANAVINPDGTFAIRNVPQGSYVLQARAARGFGAALVTVIDRDVTDVAIKVLPPTTARGHVTFQGGTPPPKEQVRIAVGPTDVVSGPVGGNAPPRVKINDDWTFELPGLQSIGVVVASAPPGWQLARVTVAGEDITDKPYDFRLHDVADVDIVLSDHWGTVRATVTDVAGQPAPGCAVIVFAQDATKWTYPSRHVRIGRANQQGVFTDSGLPGGSYLVVAVPQSAAPGTEADATLLESLRAAATRVTVTEGEQTAVALKLVR